MFRSMCFLLAAATATDPYTPDFGPNFVPSQEDNMNGNYASSTTPGGRAGLFPIKFRDYPGTPPQPKPRTPHVPSSNR
jgi:hypothetical protein